MTPYREQCHECRECQVLRRLNDWLMRANDGLKTEAEKERRRFWLDSGKRVGQVGCIVGLLIVVGIVLRTVMQLPVTPDRCVESATVIGNNYGRWHACEGGASASTEVLADNAGVLVRCKCGERADGGEHGK